MPVTTEEVVRADKKAKKEKKISKKDIVFAQKATSPDPSPAPEPTRKRKRDVLPDEIEIDVNLPEPASKKAARKAKKEKLNPTATKSASTISAVKPDADASAANDKASKRSDHGVWIGNLPWSATKDSLRAFLVENAEIKDDHITRVHMPAPSKPPNPNWTTKPQNKGFAYVDFATELAMYSAIALTETKMDGRALLIKNAKSFEGRPEPVKVEGEQAVEGGKTGSKKGHPPNKRVFVGNLSFDVTKQDLRAHYSQCGAIEHLHMATFEDTGKCKGYAWVTFSDVEAATSAVNGFVYKYESEIKRQKAGSPDDADEEGVQAPQLRGKKRKWLLNKLAGRELRCEFAEDSTTRYNKRFGKDKPETDAPVEGVHPARRRQNFSRAKVDPRSIKSGAAHSNAQRASQAIVESQGKKITF